MAKLGKFSTGLKGAVSMSGGDIGRGNEGWGGRQNMMDQFKTLEPRNRPTKGYVGAAKDPETHRAMSQFSKK